MRRSGGFLRPCPPGLRAFPPPAFALLLLTPALLAACAYTQTLPEDSIPKWDFSVWAAGASGEENTNSFAEAQILQAGVFLGRVTQEMGAGWRRGRLEYGADFIPVFVQFTPQQISGTAFDPVILRWNSSVRRGRVSPFAELGGGALHTGVNFPAGDSSRFNFMARGGAGVLIAAGKGRALELACRWWHISNANLGRENPEFNGIQVSLGWHWSK